MAELTEDDASSVVFQGGVVQEPGCVWLWTSSCLLFRGEHGLGVWKLAAEQSLAEWYAGGGKLVGGWMGTLQPLEGRSLTRG